MDILRNGVEYMSEIETNEIVSQSTDIALSAAGSLVGFAMGGPVGAVVGSVLSPTTKLAVKAGQLWLHRRQMRLTSIVEHAFYRSGRNEDEILQEMIDSPDWCDTIIFMIQQLVNSDPELDLLFSEIMAHTINAKEESERNRLIVLNNAIKGLNKVQALILKHMYHEGGVMSAQEMSEQVRVPELELRNAVRDLELRGMIADNGKEPTIWNLRELGFAVAKTINTIEIMEVE